MISLQTLSSIYVKLITIEHRNELNELMKWHTFSNRKGTPHFMKIKRTTIHIKHHISALDHHFMALFLVSTGDCNIYASVVLGSSFITSLTYSLSSFTWIPPFECFLSKSSAESGISYLTPETCK